MRVGLRSGQVGRNVLEQAERSEQELLVGSGLVHPSRSKQEFLAQESSSWGSRGSCWGPS